VTQSYCDGFLWTREQLGGVQASRCSQPVAYKLKDPETENDLFLCNVHFVQKVQDLQERGLIPKEESP
jgi:hypothetical protein